MSTGASRASLRARLLWNLEEELLGEKRPSGCSLLRPEAGHGGQVGDGGNDHGQAHEDRDGQTFLCAEAQVQFLSLHLAGGLLSGPVAIQLVVQSLEVNAQDLRRPGLILPGEFQGL